MHYTKIQSSGTEQARNKQGHGSSCAAYERNNTAVVRPSPDIGLRPDMDSCPSACALMAQAWWRKICFRVRKFNAVAGNKPTASKDSRSRALRHTSDTKMWPCPDVETRLTCCRQCGQCGAQGPCRPCRPMHHLTLKHAIPLVRPLSLACHQLTNL